LLLKASPLIDELSLYDVVNTPGVTADLSHISTPAVSVTSYPNIGVFHVALTCLPLLQKVSGYLPADDGLKHALTGADIIIIPAGIPRAYHLPAR
jgi:malate dehydrogenase